MFGSTKENLYLKCDDTRRLLPPWNGLFSLTLNIVMHTLTRVMLSISSNATMKPLRFLIRPFNLTHLMLMHTMAKAMPSILSIATMKPLSLLNRLLNLTQMKQFFTIIEEMCFNGLEDLTKHNRPTKE